MGLSFREGKINVKGPWPAAFLPPCTAIVEETASPHHNRILGVENGRETEEERAGLPTVSAYVRTEDLERENSEDNIHIPSITLSELTHKLQSLSIGAHRPQTKCPIRKTPPPLPYRENVCACCCFVCMIFDYSNSRPPSLSLILTNYVPSNARGICLAILVRQQLALIVDK